MLSPDLEYAEHLHPGTRLIAPDEAVAVLDLWIETAWRRDECERFIRLVELREQIVTEPDEVFAFLKECRAE